MDELLLVRVLVRLVQVHMELGEDSYKDAVQGALVAIGRSSLRAAEMQTRPPQPSTGNVIDFETHHLNSYADYDIF